MSTWTEGNTNDCRYINKNCIHIGCNNSRQTKMSVLSPERRQIILGPVFYWGDQELIRALILRGTTGTLLHVLECSIESVSHHRKFQSWILWCVIWFGSNPSRTTRTPAFWDTPRRPWLPILVIHVRFHVIKRPSQSHKISKIYQKFKFCNNP